MIHSNTRGVAILPAIFIVIALMAVVGVGYVLIKQPFAEKTNTNTISNIVVKNTNTSTTTNTNSTVSNTNISLNTNVNTSTVPVGWKTYTNSQYGFSFQYPNDGWVFSDQKVPYGSASYDSFGWSKNITPTNPSESNVIGEFGVTVFPRINNESGVDTYLRLVPTDFSQTVQSNITVGGIDGIKVVGVPSMVNYNAVFIPKGNYTYRLSQYAGLSDQQFSQILFTFTLTK